MNEDEKEYRSLQAAFVEAMDDFAKAPSAPKEVQPNARCWHLAVSHIKKHNR